MNSCGNDYQFDVVCVYNCKHTLGRLLLASLAQENPQLYRLHLVDNCAGEFASAAAAFRSVLPACRGRWVMFVHQDVIFLQADWLAQCAQYLEELGDFGVAGVAGMVPDPNATNPQRGRGTVRTGPTPECGEMWSWGGGGNAITAQTDVQTVDELLFIMQRETAVFGDDMPDGFHLYGVAQCLKMLAIGRKNYVLPLPVYHQSSGIRKSRIQIVLSLGPLPAQYYSALKKLCKQHRTHLPVIYTTCSEWHTRRPLIAQRICKLAIGLRDMLLRKF